MLIRRLEEGDREQWEQLFAGYAAFYQVQQDAEMRSRVWGWIMNGRPAQVDTQTQTQASALQEAIVAVDEASGRLLGLAHFRQVPRPLTATMTGYIDDLFVAEAARGSGAAQALIAAVREQGEKRGWSVIRWLTSETNYRARSVYDRVAERRPVVVYQMSLV
eukprot:m.34273 g.34273  ORF g.34273 m.34273 type:complete len:162 (-) comp11130_c0_seq1:452-937(-)